MLQLKRERQVFPALLVLILMDQQGKALVAGMQMESTLQSMATLMIMLERG